ncbi:hypothetical protein, partial [uncultured Chloroflexus sp.]|uniref:hypothetical protein n=1 Tax=uncultured Chloroflexus sp. TaxID=214040 RepID=UPI002638A476
RRAPVRQTARGGSGARTGQADGAGRVSAARTGQADGAGRRRGGSRREQRATGAQCPSPHW